MVQYFDHPELPLPSGYHHAARSDRGAIFTAGQTCSPSVGGTLSEVTLREQVESATVNAVTALIGAGGDPTLILSLDVFIVGLNADTVDDVYAGLGRAAKRTGFGKVPITILGIAALTDPDALAEVRAVGSALAT